MTISLTPEEFEQLKRIAHGRTTNRKVELDKRLVDSLVKKGAVEPLGIAVIITPEGEKLLG